MATTTNLFDLLSGIGKSEQLQTLKKKSKPKKAKKPETAVLANGVHEDQAGSPRHLEVSDVSEPGNIVVPVTHVLKAPAQPQYVVIEASEAIAICERAAREAKSLSDKIKLWKDWTRQAADRSGRGLKYKDADGGYLDFTQVVVRSKGLEISIESCLASGLTQDKEPVLSQLLSTFLPADRAHLAPALASTLIRISALFTLESPDTLSTAQRAVFAAIAALKVPSSGSASASTAGAGGGGGSVAGWLARVAAVEKEVATLNAAAQKLQQGASTGVTREQTQNMKQVLALFEEKFQLLQPESVPAAKPTASARVSPCEQGLSDLRAIISSHMQARHNNKSSDTSPAAQRSAALASCRREEAILDARTSELLGEVRTLEARLHGLHMEQAELQAKRLQVQHMRSGLDSSVVSGGKGGRAQPQGEGLGDAHYRDELAAVEALHCIMDPSRAAHNGSSGGAHQQADQVSSVMASQTEAAVELVSQGVAYLELALRAMREMPAKLAFCRTRCSQAEKLFALGAMSAASSSAVAGAPVVGARQKEEAEKLLAETLKTAEDLVLGSGQVWNDMHLRYDALMRFSPPAATHVATLVRSIDALCTQVREAHAIALTEPAPAAPVAAPQPRPQSQNRSQRQGQSPAAAASAAAPQAAQQAQSRSDSPQAAQFSASGTEQRVQQERRPAAAAATSAPAEVQQPAAAASAAMAALLPKAPQQQAQSNRKPPSEQAAPDLRAAVVQLVAASHSTSSAPAPTPTPHHPAPAAAPVTPHPTPAAAPAIAAVAPSQLPNGGPASAHTANGNNETADSPPPGAPAAVAPPASKPAAPAAPPRSWGKVAVAPVSTSSDDSLPTPAEAALALSSDADGPKEGTSANLRRGGQRSGGGARLPRA